jgi:hypothetical protein
MKYLITYSDFETEIITGKNLLAAEKEAHKRAAQRNRTVKTVVEI